MECGVCGLILDETSMIKLKNGHICIDCARKLLNDIVTIVEREDPIVAGDLIVEKLAQAKLLQIIPLHA